LEAVKILSGEKILFSLTSIRHWVIEFRNIYGLRSERDRMTSRHFNWARWTSKILNRRILATTTITNCWWSKNRVCMKSKRQKSAIKTFRGSIIHSQTSTRNFARKQAPTVNWSWVVFNKTTLALKNIIKPFKKLCRKELIDFCPSLLRSKVLFC